MGSYITLDIGKLEVDWGKNSNFFDHSPLFRPSDVKEIPYLYANDVVIEQEGYNIAKLKYLVDWLISEWLHRIKR